MKVHEAINLYNLHANPENLKGHQQVNQKLQQMVNWGFIWYDDGSLDVDQQHTTLVEMFQGTNAGEPVDPDQFEIEPYDSYDLETKLMNLKDVFLRNSVDYSDEEDRRYFETKWKREEKKFNQVIAKVRPQTMIDPTTGHYFGSAMMVVGAPVDYVRFCLGFASQQPE